MLNHLRALGLALIAALSLSVSVTSTAGAADAFTSEAEENPSVTALAEGWEFKFATVTIECTTAHFKGKITNFNVLMLTSSSFTGTINKTHTGHCSAAGGTATVSNNECEHTLTGETSGEGEAGLWIQCEEGNKIEIKSELGITISIPAQTPTESGVSYTNSTPSSGQVTIDMATAGITYSCSPHFLCTLGGLPSEGNNGSYSGALVAEEESEGGLEVS